MSAVPKWQPGTLYAPGFLVSPVSNAVVTQVQPNNNSFESGLTHWAVTPSGPAGQTSSSSAVVFDGAESALFAGYAGGGPRSSSTATLTNDYMAPVVPGRVINFSCWIQYDVGPSPGSAFANGSCGINWYNSSSGYISTTYATNPAPNGTPGYLSQVGGIWEKSSGQGIAPAGAAYAAAVIFLNNNTSGSTVYADLYQWDYTEQGYPPGLVFVATQAGVATSGNSEPVWPVIAGNTVTDGGVTWTAEFASLITWQATSILTSGATEPIWPTTVGGSIVDNDIIWTATDGRITDPNCPQSTIVAIGASKVFIGNSDIINFCATGNALDWTASQDAGFIPFGMNNYGNESVKALNLYRSNLVAFNSLGYQMWQIDPDPANMAILDAEPVGCAYSKSLQPVNNDLCFLSAVGIRNIGTAGAAGNLQAGSFGKQIDPLVKAAIAQLGVTGYEVKSLYFTGTGQYWLFFGPQAFVLTINGTSTMSWSRYVFPATITDWTVLAGVLYLRAGDLVWQVDELQALDDFGAGAGNINFQVYMAWEYLDFGTIGVDKQMEGFDIVMKGQAQISFGYNQSNRTQATDWYDLEGDTVPGTMIPFPLVAPSIQVRLQFNYGQIAPISGDQPVGGYPVAEWSALNVYLTPLVKQ
jgi:hypothetical protein